MTTSHKLSTKTQRFFQAKAFAGEFSKHRPAAQHEQNPLTA